MDRRSSMLNEIRLALDDDVAAELKRRIDAGEFRDAAVAVAAALRYYFDRHDERAWAEYVEKEVAWSRRHAGR
jgi:hypothetical protein